MRVVFMGTPDFAVPALELLAREHEVALVLTRPDAVRSRGKKLEPSPVKLAAQRLGLPLIETKRMTDEVLDALRSAAADIFCVAAFGCILPDEVLTMAPLGCVNIHASLLPRWRGAAPIQRAILAGDERTGVSIMRIGHGVDTGAYCAQASIPLNCATDDGFVRVDAQDATARLAEAGAKLLVETLPAIADGTAVWAEQDEALVTHAEKISKAEFMLDPADSAEMNLRRVLASSDAAPARCSIAGKSIRVFAAIEVLDPDGAADIDAGAFAKVGKRVILGCSDGGLELLCVRPDGKRAMPASDWAAGLQQKRGSWGRIQ